MNTSYLLKIKYLLGLSNSKEIFDWGFQEIEQGNNDNEMLELVTLKSDNYGGIIEKLTKISSSQIINKCEVVYYFYCLFDDIFEKSNDIVEVEELLIHFYNLVKDDISFDEAEKLSFSIIENDLSLRKSNLSSQISDDDIMIFLRNGKQIS
jgi:hypothetical protein